ncbi:NAD-dependent epimerase/dehydratase family protein [Microaerobacter geothermalis]|uniref:NAD-dependent epimerase/dehydratase family protein n=1 Tax=Microaerobacter geothermalis TaxID=674972 RepID=UPI001F45A933|nr:NAD-dependent epimerase/dehydratase family protein [Microaerobacter geothermalis]MCF6095025.1 NAD-dependent epimerase/dehydratase family protein [Microaerobacter geothermalis]
MKIGVIGATGMIGHHTAKAVMERGHELVVIHRETSNLDVLDHLTFTSMVADLYDESSLIKALSNVDAVIHCAAYYPTEPLPWYEDVRRATNQMETFLSACEKVTLHRIVYLGAAIALPKNPSGEPGTEELIYPTTPQKKNPYLQVKYELDRMARERASDKLPIVIGIPSMCFGEYDYGPSTGRLILDIVNGDLPAYIEGKRNVIYAGDAGHGLVLACEKGKIGERYLFTGTNITMSDLVHKIADIANVQPPQRQIPLSLASFATKTRELKYRTMGGTPPKISSTAVAIMALGQFLNGEKARNELHFNNALTLEETIKITIDWFKKVGYIK